MQSIRNGVDGRIWEIGGEILKDAEGVFSEHCNGWASRGVRGHTPLENFGNLGLLECISRILGHEYGYSNRTQISLILDSLFNGKQIHACNLLKSREPYMTSRARGNIHTHSLCCFRTQNPRFREYARLLSNWAIDRRNRWPPGRNYLDFGNILFFFFFF